MAQEVTLNDDMDGSPGAETVHFAFEGKSYEINLSPINRAAFGMLMRAYVEKARRTTGTDVLVCLPARLNHSSGMLRLLGDQSLHAYPLVATATGPGEFHLSGGDLVTDRPLLQEAPDPQLEAPPRLGEVPRQTAAEQPKEVFPQPTGVPDTQVREWARRYSVPGMPLRGRVPAAIRTIFEAFQRDDLNPWRELLLDNDIDPDKALADARALTLVGAEQKPEPTEAEVLRSKARKAGRLNTAQLTRLRIMNADEKGRATSDGTSADNASYGALADRGLCAAVTRRKNRTTYQITDVGKVYFEVRGISPTEGTTD